MSSLKARGLTLALVLVSVACGGGEQQEISAESIGRQATFRCQGNEPFWNLQIDGAEARYRSLAEGDVDGVFEGTFQWDDSVEPPIFEWQGVETGETGARLSASIRQEQCLDTMSDETPPYSHWIRLRAPNGREATGCCRTEDLPAGERTQIALGDVPIAVLDVLEPDVWARRLLDLRPALEACLDRVTGSGPRVTYAWSIEGGLVGARLRDGQGGWFECVAAGDGSSIDRFDALTTADFPLQHENRIVFTPAAHDPPSGNCYEHERVVGQQGEPIGWLSFNTC